jgi:hypothetical protein
MNPPQVAKIDSRVQVAKAFAQQFNHFEWEYLCSHQWFLTSIDRALETGDFFGIQDRAVKTLVDDKIRPRWKGKTRQDDLLSWLV